MLAGRLAANHHCLDRHDVSPSEQVVGGTSGCNHNNRSNRYDTMIAIILCIGGEKNI